jgi:hypothetical protein
LNTFRWRERGIEARDLVKVESVEEVIAVPVDARGEILMREAEDGEPVGRMSAIARENVPEREHGPEELVVLPCERRGEHVKRPCDALPIVGSRLVVPIDPFGVPPSLCPAQRFRLRRKRTG